MANLKHRHAFQQKSEPMRTRITATRRLLKGLIINAPRHPLQTPHWTHILQRRNRGIALQKINRSPRRINSITPPIRGATHRDPAATRISLRLRRITGDARRLPKMASIEVPHAHVERQTIRKIFEIITLRTSGAPPLPRRCRDTM
eukprot:6637015-Prymnesium_polylepis.1